MSSGRNRGAGQSAPAVAGEGARVRRWGWLGLGAAFAAGGLVGGLGALALVPGPEVEQTARRPFVPGRRAGVTERPARPEVPSAPDSEPAVAPSALPSAVGASPPGHFIPYGVWPEGLSEAALPDAVEQAVAQAGTACAPSSVEIAGMDCASYPCLLAVSGSASREERATVVEGGLCTLRGVELKPQTNRLFRDSDYFEGVYAVVDPMHPPPQGMEHRIAMEARMAELDYVALPKE